MNSIIDYRFIPQHLLYFIAGNRCCQQFACTFREHEQEQITNSARELGLRTELVCIEGQKCVKVYKKQCKHYLEEPKVLVLSSQRISNIFILLSRIQFLGTPPELYLSTDFCRRRDCDVKLPAKYLPLAGLRIPQIGPKVKSETYKNYIKELGKYESILGLIYVHRVISFKAELSADKSVFLPLMILEDSEIKMCSARVICIERKEFLATYNCDRLAQLIGENIGDTVGVKLDNYQNACSNSHIIYTTAKHFLRSLVNKSPGNKFHGISHIILNDIHMQEPYADILLNELHYDLTMNQNLKIILLSQVYDTSELLAYFGEGAELCMDDVERNNCRLLYLEDIRSQVALAVIQRRPDVVYKDLPQMFSNTTYRNDIMDRCLQAYDDLGTDAAFRPFIYAVNYELVPINYAQSVSGKTAIIIAVEHNNSHHLRVLLYLGADPFATNDIQESAIRMAALNRNNSECIDILNSYSLNGGLYKNTRPELVDFDVIIDVLHLFCTMPEYPEGNILIILPSYYHVAKLNYMILTHYLIGSLRKFLIYVLHSKMKKEYVDELINAPLEARKIILSTDIIESLSLPVKFQYLIDTMSKKHIEYNSTNYSCANQFAWLSKDRLLRRQLLLDPNAKETYCLRLISQNTYDGLNEKSVPRLQTGPLDKICLMVKFLSPHTMISEYLSYTIAPPPLINIHHTVQYLKKIDVLDETEEVTWMGCRILDLPVPCQLGRTVIFGILLQCIDPILTIVSALCTTDPLTIPFNSNVDHLFVQHTMYIQSRIKAERERLSVNQFSDHIMFVHLFREWQEAHNRDNSPPHLTDEYGFILDALMERLSDLRANIVTSLRAGNLVHGQGLLSFPVINMKSNSWPIVKAALTGGLYPNICAVDSNKSYLKSGQTATLHLSPSSVLRNFLEPFDNSVSRFESPWLICTSIKNCIMQGTVVDPLSVALFAGSHKVQWIPCEDERWSNDRYINLFIDEWIWMLITKSVVELILKTRQYFTKIYKHLLKNCDNSEKWKYETSRVAMCPLLTEILTKIFEEDDIEWNIGCRPSTNLQDKYLLTINTYFNWNQEVELTTPICKTVESMYGVNFIEKQFFLLYTEDSPKDFFIKSNGAYIARVLGKFAQPIETANRHIFVILYRKNPDIMTSLCRAQTIRGKFQLKEYFRKNIPISEIRDPCALLKFNVPSFDKRLISSLIDKRVGSLIMDLFAFRNHWIHNS